MRVEHVATGMALACAVHCVAVPLLAAAACWTPEAHLAGTWVEAGLLGSAGLIGYATLGWSFRQHRRCVPLVLFTTGLALMLLAHCALTGTLSTTGTVVGALILLAAQHLNRRCPAPCCSGNPRVEGRIAPPQAVTRRGKDFR